MRPLDKGERPTHENGDEISPDDYDKWRSHLIGRIGYYCAYCNIPLSHNLNVEHVVPKKPPEGFIPGDPIAWENMLLACGPCNNSKGNNPIDYETYYFPEEHNTVIPFQIVPTPNFPGAAIVRVALELNEVQKKKAKDTIRLTGLGVIDTRDNIVDIRWKRRFDAIDSVEGTFYLFEQTLAAAYDNMDAAAKNVAAIAKTTGFFSIWFDKFKDYPRVLMAIQEEIPGTASSCFDPENGYQPIPRNPHNTTDPI